MSGLSSGAATSFFLRVFTLGFSTGSATGSSLTSNMLTGSKGSSDSVAFDSTKAVLDSSLLFINE